MAETHQDLGLRCLVIHADESAGMGCIICTCGAHVRPHKWAAHVAPPPPDPPAPPVPPAQGGGDA
jgi:hypothetical protein